MKGTVFQSLSNTISHVHEFTLYQPIFFSVVTSMPLANLYLQLRQAWVLPALLSEFIDFGAVRKKHELLSMTAWVSLHDQHRNSGGSTLLSLCFFKITMYFLNAWHGYVKSSFFYHSLLYLYLFFLLVRICAMFSEWKAIFSFSSFHLCPFLYLDSRPHYWNYIVCFDKPSLCNLWKGCGWKGKTKLANCISLIS